MSQVNNCVCEKNVKKEFSETLKLQVTWSKLYKFHEDNDKFIDT